ncbi:MAG: NAD(P)/FAD-dependent oxidoreductase [Dissulfurispiraceae bacterium]
MPEIKSNLDQYILEDGANIAVIGGGPTGSFFSIFALKMARMMGKQIQLTIFEPKDFTKDGPAGCNRCGGIISELLVQTLAVEGINLPDSVVRKGINSYNLHTNHGDVYIATPELERTIATVYRGGGPKGMIPEGKESFDNFLLKDAIKEGAVLDPLRVDRIKIRDRKPVLFTKDRELGQFDLVVGAFGINSTTPKMFEDIGFGYQEPPTVTTAIAELFLGEENVEKHFGNSVHLFLLPDKGMKFAAMIPKGSYVTLCVLGKEMHAKTVTEFLEKSVVKNVVKDIAYSVACRCLPKMNVGAPLKPFTDRVVTCGDAGSTRLFKDGLGAAYLMGKAAAKTALFQGVSARHFQEDYYPVYHAIIIDNRYGQFLFTVTDAFRKNKLLTEGMLRVVRREQKGPAEPRILSSILWNMFTGNERYKNIFPKAFDIRMHGNFLREFSQVLTRRAS